MNISPPVAVQTSWQQQYWLSQLSEGTMNTKVLLPSLVVIFSWASRSGLSEGQNNHDHKTRLQFYLPLEAAMKRLNLQGLFIAAVRGRSCSRGKCTLLTKRKVLASRSRTPWSSWQVCVSSAPCSSPKLDNIVWHSNSIWRQDTVTAPLTLLTNSLQTITAKWAHIYQDYCDVTVFHPQWVCIPETVIVQNVFE